MSEPLVAVRSVCKDFDDGAVPALRGVDVTVAEGEWLAVTGPSGCGKSTLLHLIAALDRPTSGTVTVGGQDLSRLRDAAAYRRTQVGLVFQLHDLLPNLTAGQNVEVAMFGCERSRTRRRARARQLLADVDLAGREQRQPTKLSGGERQRVAIARALANDPPLLLADEPTGNLDTVAVQRVVALLERLRADNPRLTVIMVTHDGWVASRADRVVELCDGVVVGEWRPDHRPDHGANEIDPSASSVGDSDA